MTHLKEVDLYGLVLVRTGAEADTGVTGARPGRIDVGIVEEWG